MKRETLRHPKTYALTAQLGAQRPMILGYLTLLWDYTGEVAPQGDVGKWPDAVIAQACDWHDDPQVFISALVSTGWLDQIDDPAVRLLVHDWPDHAEEFVRAKLKRAEKDFHALYRSPSPKRRPQRGACERCSNGVPTSYPLSNPNQSNLNHSCRPKLRFVEEDMALARWMFDRIRKLQPDRKEPDFDKWANTIRLMREQDKRTHKDIRELFGRANRDEFWQTNILSPEKLRAKWDDLDLRLRRHPDGRQARGGRPKAKCLRQETRNGQAVWVDEAGTPVGAQ